MHVVDASVWVSRYMPTDRYHDISTRWLLDQVDRTDPLIAPTVALAEVAGAVARQADNSDLGHSARELMESDPFLRIVPVDVELASLAARLAADLRLRGADAIYVALAFRLDLPLITWDRQQRERAIPVVDARAPAQQRP